MASCAGGGGGGSSGPTIPPPPPPPPPPTTNPSLPLNPPSTSSVEYQRSYGLAAVHADAGFNLGATGKGVTVAVLDTGFNPGTPDMVGAYSPDSIDIVAGRNLLGGVDGHGGKVAGVLGARFNGLGAIGVAYESTVLGIRADSTAASAPCDNICRFSADDLARGIDYAVAKGAKVVNISLAAFDTDADRSTLFEAALSRAVAAGVVFTVAASNSGEANPATHALYAADSRYLGAFLAIGATGPDGSMASFSNRAGVTAADYLTAPGQDVPTACVDGGACELASGTSFAAPHVAGALAMLLQYYPNLSARDAVSILLRTADDKGDAGTDVVYGRGALNIARAFQPVGAQSLALPDGGVVDLPAAPLGSALGGAFGDAVAAGGGLSTLIHDDYDRPFAIDLASAYSTPRRTSSLIGAAPPVREAAQTFGLPAGAMLTLAAQAPMFEASEQDASPVRAFLHPEDPSSVSALMHVGGLDLTAWSGHGPVAAPAGLGGGNAFANLAAADRAVIGVWRAGRFAFGGEGGWAERRTPLSMTPVDASTYATASAAYLGRTFSLSVSGGALSEPRGALGSELSPASPLALPARTRFAALGLDRPLNTPLGDLMLRAEASVGRTFGGGELVDIDKAVSTSWRLALRGACVAALPCHGFGLEIAQPLRVERGTFRALLADATVSEDGSPTFSERRFSAAPSARELDLRLNTDAALGAGVLRLEAAAAFNPAHQRSEAELALSAGWRTRF